MKNLLALTLLSGLFLQINAHPGNGKLNLDLTKITAASGELHVVLFMQPVGFPYSTDNSFMHLTIDLADPNAAKEFTSIPFGEYAMLIFHDENGNGKLDRNFAGKPKEAYGFSNYPNHQWQAKYDACAFLFNTSGQTIELILNNSMSEGQKQETIVSGSVAK